MNPVAEQSSIPATTRIGAVLFTSDNTLLGPSDGLEQLTVDLQLARARRAGLLLGLVATPRRAGRSAETAATMRRLDDLYGPFDVVGACFHALIGERKCMCVGLDPGTIRAAAAALRLPPSRCLVVGASPGDADAALLAGANGLVMSVPEAIDMAVESVVAPDRALEHSLEILELAWKTS